MEIGHNRMNAPLYTIECKVLAMNGDSKGVVADIKRCEVYNRAKLGDISSKVIAWNVERTNWIKPLCNWINDRKIIET